MPKDLEESQEDSQLAYNLEMAELDPSDYNAENPLTPVEAEHVEHAVSRIKKAKPDKDNLQSEIRIICEELWITDKVLVHSLGKTALFAMTNDAKGNPIEDNNARIKASELLYKLKGHLGNDKIINIINPFALPDQQNLDSLY